MFIKFGTHETIDSNTRFEDSNSVLFIFLLSHNCSVTTNTIQITFPMQIEHSETSLTPPTPSSPNRETQSPEAIASLSSGSSDNALGMNKFDIV